MIQAWVKPLTISDLASLDAEFQKMDEYNRTHPEFGIMLAQVRRIVDKHGHPTGEFHIGGQFLETETAKKVMEAMGKC